MKNTHDRQNQKGATMIILALIIATLMAVTIVGISQLTVSKKKNSKSLDASETAYQKADEAAECALWGRKAALENGSDPGNAEYKMFAKNITNYYCDKYSSLIKIYEQLGPTVVTADCASPLLAANIFTEGSQEIANNFSDNSTKKRGVGATVNVVASSVIEPFVTCNKLAECGTVKAAVRNPGGCNAAQLSNATSATNNGWLVNWPECSSICFSDPNNCAYYDTSLDNGKDNLYGAPKNEGAHWCWTVYQDIEVTDVGTMCYCLDQNKSDATDINYWNHPDVLAKEFCHPCRRLYDPAGGWGNNTCGGGGKVGQICKEAWSLPAFNAGVWGDPSPGKPSAEADAGILDGNNSYSCYCRDFWNANPTWCAANGISQAQSSTP